MAIRYDQESTVPTTQAFTNVKPVYETLCFPHLECATFAWGPSSRKYISYIAQFQGQAVGFVAGIKGRDGVKDAKSRLELVSRTNEGETSG